MNEPFGDIPGAKRKKKVDLEALTSVFKRIPGMNITTARDLLDLGFQDIDELRGRSPEALFAEIREMRPKSPDDLINYLRLAVYFAETDDPDPHMLEAWKWADPDLRG